MLGFLCLFVPLCVHLVLPVYAKCTLVGLSGYTWVCIAVVVCLDNYDSNQARASVKHRWQIARHKASSRKTFMCLVVSVSVLI